MISASTPIPTYEGLRDALTVSQAEDISGRSSFLLREDIRTGKLTAYKVGGRWKIVPADLSTYLETLVAPSPSAR